MNHKTNRGVSMIREEGIVLPEDIDSGGDGNPTLFKEVDGHVLVMYPGGDYEANLYVERFIEWLRKHKPELLK